jgi:hypothetical protein
MADLNDTQEDTSYLDMTDEEAMNFDSSKLPADEPVVDEPEDEADEASTEDKKDDADDAPDAEDPPEAPAESEDGDDDADEGTQDKGKPEPVAEKTTEPAEKEPVADAAIDYKAAYERLLAPFKANGKDVAVNSVEDAISLMQMGANYNKKMQALKPNLKLMKMLENNGMLSEEKLSFLMDLEKKNPQAINKLVKDSGLDPMDFDAEKASEYKPNTYAVDDREMELDSVLDELQSSKSYNRTLDIVSNKWDVQSKQVIADSPQLLRVINGHIESGIYDLILTQVESDRMYGRLTGLSDIEAYRKVGDQIEAKGGFANLGHQNTPPPAGSVIVPSKPKPNENKLRDKKRAASSSQPTAVSQPAKEFNPLSLSDEEFMAASNKRYN